MVPVLTPQTPPVLSATPASASQINLSWKSVPGANEYAVFEVTSQGLVQCSPVSTSTEFSATNLSADTSYSFEVLDSGAWGLGASNVVSALTFPAAPSPVPVVVSASEVDIYWYTVGATSYQVDENVGGTWKQVYSETAPTTGYNPALVAPITGLEGGTTYQFKLGATNASGTTWSSAISALTCPAAPSVSAAGLNQSTIWLTWTYEPTATQYSLQIEENGGWYPLQTLGSGQTWTIAYGLSASTGYNFRVGATNASGTTWGYSSTAYTTPAAPAVTASAVSASQIDVGWSGLGAASYQLDESVGGVWKQVVSVPASASLPIYFEPVTGLHADTTYQFKVGATNASGTTWSSVMSVLTFPAAPSVSAAELNTSMISLTWTSEPGAALYSIEVEENGDWVSLQHLGSSHTAYTVYGLSAGTAYNFRVGASDASGTSWGYSATAYTTPAAPTLTAIAKSDSSIALSWNRVTGANGYTVSVSSGGTVIQTISMGSTQTSDTLDNLKPDTTYTFQVAASNSSGKTLSSAVTVTTLVVPPTLSARVVSPTQVDLSWNRVAGATDYVIEDWDAATLSWVELGEVTGTTGNYDVVNLRQGTYDFSVVAVGAPGSSRSNGVSVTT